MTRTWRHSKHLAEAIGALLVGVAIYGPGSTATAARLTAIHVSEAAGLRGLSSSEGICASASREGCWEPGQVRSPRAMAAARQRSAFLTVRITKVAFGSRVAIASISCSSRADCVAIGWSSNLSALVVLQITNGTPGPPRLVPGTTYKKRPFTDPDQPVGIACPRDGLCFGVGNSGGASGLLVRVSDGKPEAPMLLRGVFYVTGVSCSSAALCLASGTNGGYDGALGVVKDGRSVSPLLAAGTAYLKDVSCSWGRTECAAIAAASFSSPATEVVRTVGTHVGHPVSIPDAATLDHLACPTPRECYITGSEADGTAVVVSLVRGRSPRLTTSGVSLGTLSCPSSSRCIALGEHAIVPILNGSVESATAVRSSILLGVVACPSASRCYVVGEDGGRAVVVSLAISTNALRSSARRVQSLSLSQIVEAPSLFTPGMSVGQPEGKRRLREEEHIHAAEGRGRR